jgi:hypothetical protein
MERCLLLDASLDVLRGNIWDASRLWHQRRLVQNKQTASAELDEEAASTASGSSLRLRIMCHALQPDLESL